MGFRIYRPDIYGIIGLMSPGILELALVMFIAAGLGIAAKFLKQPIILAYLGTGALIAYFGWTKLIDQETFHFFSDLGIMFLLFLVGLEINYDSFRVVGKHALLLGFGQILFTFLVGYGLAIGLGLTAIHAAYVAFALTISSTVIVVKLLSEKRELHSLSGRFAVGILLVQDFAVILLLVFLSGFAGDHEFSFLHLVLTACKGIALFAAMFWLGRRFAPLVMNKIGHAPEIIFLVSLAWMFFLAAFVQRIGFSIEIAGFLAGISLANASEHFQISGRIRSLRDFFILIFFVLLGSSIITSNFSGLSISIVIFSLFVLIGNPLIVLLMMGIMGYRKRTGFLTGVAIAQISEFSLVLATLGRQIGHLDDATVSLITAVGIITITASSYLITHADTIFRKIHHYLSMFERRKVVEDSSMYNSEKPRPIVLIGAHRTGQAIVASVNHEDVLVVDFDPEVIADLQSAGFAYLFGDVADPEIFEEAKFDKARLVISTNPDFEDNAQLLRALLALPNRPKIILRADNERQAILLYRMGADYVLLPHFTAGQYLGKTIALDPQLQIVDQLKERDLAMLQNRNRFSPFKESHRLSPPSHHMKS